MDAGGCRRGGCRICGRAPRYNIRQKWTWPYFVYLDEGGAARGESRYPSVIAVTNAHGNAPSYGQRVRALLRRWYATQERWKREVQGGCDGPRPPEDEPEARNPNR